jgi:hypothetical protein
MLRGLDVKHGTYYQCVPLRYGSDTKTEGSRKANEPDRRILKMSDQMILLAWQVQKFGALLGK